ncbi:MAG: ArsR family transcriptional regulator, lead/cadmium/zinc/bismuth-responsive transcriptional [Chloroflexota bacterium]|jgi:DNA-binding transcriptional ArsR family regulator|nr:ArsR family transcriptional regulator, lead/cadmium/zinc/bismuth-responsive transcriptional [Chloroflexota bacterium]
MPASDEVLLPDELAAQMAELFRALADPTRTKIVNALVHDDMTTSGIAALMGVSPPLVSQHLRLLRALRIVKPRREGQLVYYSLDDDHIRLLVSLSLTHLREAGSREPRGE